MAWRSAEQLLFSGEDDDPPDALELELTEQAEADEARAAAARAAWDKRGAELARLYAREQHRRAGRPRHESATTRSRAAASRPE